MKSRAALRDLAKQRVELLLENALSNVQSNLQLAQRQAEISRRICLKYNLRLPFGKRQLFCRGCKRFIVAGTNARIRLGYKPKAVKITCLECGHIYRKIINKRTPISRIGSG